MYVKCMQRKGMSIIYIYFLKNVVDMGLLCGLEKCFFFFFYYYYCMYIFYVNAYE